MHCGTGWGTKTKIYRYTIGTVTVAGTRKLTWCSYAGRNSAFLYNPILNNFNAIFTNPALARLILYYCAVTNIVNKGFS